jgi:DNA-binding PadR family transcriptional regulator
MALRHALLASLLEGDASGYELAKRFDVSVANFWFATPQQLYRELERLEAERLVRGREVRQKRRPNKRVFRLTNAGRDELRAFTGRPAKPSAIRDDLLVKVQAVDDGDRDAVVEALEERAAQAEAKLALYDRLVAGLLDGRSEDDYLSAGQRVGPYLTLTRGRAFEAENVRWCRLAARALSASAAAVTR